MTHVGLPGNSNKEKLYVFVCVCMRVHKCKLVCVCGRGGGWGALMGKSFLLLYHVLLLGALRLCKHDHCILELFCKS